MSAPTTTRPAGAPLPTMLFAVLCLLTAVAPLSIDMYLPAFPAMAVELGTTASGVQLTMTTFLLGLAVGQLVIGPMSDGTGRRRPLLGGTLLCFVASVGCALAPAAELLAVARFLQGLGGAAGIVLARAVVSDTSEGTRAARLLGVLTIIVAIAPVAAPLLGGAIITGASWRAVFWVISGLVLLMFIGALVWGTETLPAEERSGGGLGAAFGAMGAVLVNRAYVGYMLTFCFGFATLFAYIAASPFVLQNILGFSAGTYAVLFALNALAITVTSAAAAALAGKISPRGMIRVGLAVMSACAVALLVLVLAGVPTYPTLAAFFLLQGSLGLVFGNATALALAASGRHAGTGSALLGAVQFLLAAAIAPVVGVRGDHDALPMAVATVVFGAVAVIAFASTRTADVPGAVRAADGEAEARTAPEPESSPALTLT